MSASSWTQGTPAGLPWGIPGIGLVIDGAMQQAPQPGRQIAVALEGTGRAAGMVGLSSQVAHVREAA